MSQMDRAEAMMSEALSAFRVVPYEDPEDLPDEVVWTPTQVLYDAYLKWLPVNAPSATPLSESYFGRAMHRVLGVEPALKQFRRYHGKRCWGYVGVKGPGSIIVSKSRGRPTNERKRTNAV